MSQFHGPAIRYDVLYCYTVVTVLSYSVADPESDVYETAVQIVAM